MKADADRRAAAASGDPSLSSAQRRRQLHALYEEHVDDVYRYIHRLCRDHALAEDVIQDTFAKVARTVDRPGAIEVGWLKRSARFRMIDLIRRRDNYGHKLRLVGSGERDWTVPSPDRDRSDREERLSLALEGLSPVHRAILTLHYVDGMTVRELADAFDRTDKGVEALITRARRSLREAMENDDG